MKPLAACACCVLMLAGSAAAQVASTEPGPSRDRELANIHVQQLERFISITDAQKEAFVVIFAERRKETGELVAANAEKVKAASSALSEAHRSGDQERIKRAAEEFNRLQAPIRELTTRYQERLEQVLTKEQRAKMEDARLEATIKALAYPAELTALQIKALKAAYTGDTETEKYASLRQAVSENLTPQQKAAVNKYQALVSVRGQFYRVDLTPEQQKQLEAACELLAKDTTLELKELTEKLSAKCYGLLTPEQKALMDKVLKR